MEDLTFKVTIGYGRVIGADGLAYRETDTPITFPTVKAAADAVEKYLILNLDKETGKIDIKKQDGNTIASVAFTSSKGYLTLGYGLLSKVVDLHWQAGDVIRENNTGEIFILDSGLIERSVGTMGVDCHKHGEPAKTWNLPIKNFARLRDWVEPDPFADVPDEPNDMYATINWEDGKLRLFCDDRLGSDDFKLMMANGFKYVRRQENPSIFYAPYNQRKERFLQTHFGIRDLRDDDTDLFEIVESRSDRYEGFSDNAHKSAMNSKATADKANRIPFGQPLMPGHHSYNAHRNLLDRSWNAFGKYVSELDRSSYWSNRADAAINNLNRKYTVRATSNRLKKYVKALRHWNRENNKYLNGAGIERMIWFCKNRIAREQALLNSLKNETGSEDAPEELVLEKGSAFFLGGTWQLITKVAKVNVQYYSHGCRLNRAKDTIMSSSFLPATMVNVLLAGDHVTYSNGGAMIIDIEKIKELQAKATE